MSQLLKSKCYKCSGGIEFSEEGVGQVVVCPHCGQRTKLGLNPFAKPLQIQSSGELQFFMCDPLPVNLPPAVVKQKMTRIALAKLNEETIRARTKSGDTPLHRAAKNGKIHEILGHLLQAELFIVKNNSGETPLHVAAKHGHLDQVPPQFLTKETLTMAVGPGVYSTGSGYMARTETVLHIAVRCGSADQIPKEFLTPQFLSIEAKGYGQTLLHDLAFANRLDLVSDSYADSEMWNLKDRSGSTPREVLESRIQSEAYVAVVRNEPATEKQKEKLHWFGCTWDEGITKGQASDALDECARRFPERAAEYYNRPATEEQLAMLRRFLKTKSEKLQDYADEEDFLTYREAKDLLLECEFEERASEEKKLDKEAERWLRRTES